MRNIEAEERALQRLAVAQERARERKVLAARSSLLDFCEFTMPHPDFPGDVNHSLYDIARHHELMARELEMVEAGQTKRLILVLPPRHGKTELASKRFAAWYAGRSPRHHIALASYNEKIARDFGRAVRGIMLEPEYAEVFPDCEINAGEKSADTIGLTAGGKLYFTSKKGSLTSRGGHLLLIDDPLKDRLEADSQVVRDAMWEWYNQVFKTRLMTKAGCVIIIQTRWHEDDLVGRLTDPYNDYYSRKEADRWRVVRVPALAEDTDPYFHRAPGQALWPERFDEAFLDELREGDPRGFQALYQGKPSPDEGTFFKAEDFLTYNSMDKLPPKEELSFYIASDHAVRTAQHNDKTCMIPVAVDQEDNIWILPDVYWARSTTDNIVNVMLHMIQTHKPIFWWAEKDAISASIGPFLRRRMLETGNICALDEIPRGGDKQQRAQSMKGLMSMGKVRFPAFASWYMEAKNEMLKFPHGAHDDFVDALAIIGLGLYKMRFTRKREKNAEVDRVSKNMTFRDMLSESKSRTEARAAVKQKQGW